MTPQIVLVLLSIILAAMAYVWPALTNIAIIILGAAILIGHYKT